MNQQISTAVQLTSVLERVHGANHPELTQVNELTQELAVSADAEVTADLFQQLRTITDNFAIPSDACEAYQTAYRALQAADRQLAEV